GDDRLLGRTTDQPLQLGPHRHAGLGPQLDAVLADGIEELPALRGVRAVDDLRVNTGAHRIEDVATSQVDRGGRLPGHVNAGLVSGDDGGRCLGHVAARQVVRLEVLGRHADARLYHGNLLADDHGVIDVAELHADQVEDADLRPGQQALDPEPHE